jgi:hypothetical protein
MQTRFLVRTVHCTAARIVVGDQRDSVTHLTVTADTRKLHAVRTYGPPPPRSALAQRNVRLSKENWSQRRNVAADGCHGGVGRW